MYERIYLDMPRPSFFPANLRLFLAFLLIVLLPAFSFSQDAPALSPAAATPPPSTSDPQQAPQPQTSMPDSSPVVAPPPSAQSSVVSAAATVNDPADDENALYSGSDPQAAIAAYSARAAAAQSRLDALAADISDEALRGRVAEQWKEAQTQWQAASQAADQLARRRQIVDGSAARLQTIQQEIDDIRSKTAQPDDPSRPIADLESELRELDLNLPEWTKQLGQRTARIDSQATRLAELRSAADAAQARLSEKDSPFQDNLPSELKTALQEARIARRNADHEIVAGSDYFRNIQEPLTQLDIAERDLLSRRIEYGKTRREQLAAAIADKRRAEADALRRESDAAATRFLESLPPSFRELAKENLELSDVLDQVLETEKERSHFLQGASTYIQGLQADYDRISEQLDSGGGNQVLGSYLWAKRGSLQREVYQSGQTRERIAAAAAIPGLSFSYLDELRRRIPTLEKELDALGSGDAFSQLSSGIRAELGERARKLLDNHVKLVSGLTESASRQAASLIDMDATNKELRRISSRYSSLVERHVLQLPGSPPIWDITIGQTIHAALRELSGKALFRNTFATMLSGFLETPLFFLFLILTVTPRAVLAALKRWFNVSARAPIPGTPRGLSWRVGNAFLRSYPAPLALFTAGAAIWSAASPGTDVAAAGDAFLAGSAPWLLINLWRRFCAPENVLELYTGMPRPIIDRLQRRLAAVLYVGLPLWILTWFIQNHSEPPFYQALGCMMSTLLAILAVGFWMLRMRPAVLLRGSDAYRSSMWMVLHLVIMGLGFLWLFMSVFGYNYGALLVISKAAISGLLVTAIAVAAEYWLLHLKRTREVQRARAILYYRFRDTRGADCERNRERSRESCRVNGNENEEEEVRDSELRLVDHSEHDRLTSPAVTAAAASIPPVVEKELGESLESAKRLVLWLFASAMTVTLLLQWSDLFPVQEWLGRLTLMSRESARKLTLLDLAKAAGGGWLCYAIALPLGAWANLVFCEWTPAERGTRMATLSLVRYAMFGIGVIWAAHVLGIAWSDAQWLVAALSVGLGFGLQEIILNFVSGIILLFERPVRVGDVVSIGGADGTINKINIRTTTITDFDKRELIIPNKELVTGRVVNWTLSDSVTRTVIPVTVAYGSDLELVQRLLVEAARLVDAVLDEPGPSVYLVGMEDSGLKFELRFFTGSLDDRMPAQHQIRLNINMLFNEHSVSVPFPQLDVRMRYPENASRVKEVDAP